MKTQVFYRSLNQMNSFLKETKDRICILSQTNLCQQPFILKTQSQIYENFQQKVHNNFLLSKNLRNYWSIQFSCCTIILRVQFQEDNENWNPQISNELVRVLMMLEIQILKLGNCLQKQAFIKRNDLLESQI